MCAQRMKIFLKDNAVPYRVSAPRPIPLRFQEPAASKIAKHIASGIIVQCDEPTDWCSPAFFVPKGDGKRVRLVTDYTKLNQYVVRPRLLHQYTLLSSVSIHVSLLFPISFNRFLLLQLASLSWMPPMVISKFP